MRAFLLALLLARGADPVAEAERLAAESMRLAPQRPEEALTKSRAALALTEEFEPTAFIKAGRKGEVVEDAYLAARQAYRRHRAGLYEAVGEALMRSQQNLEATRYLRRALLLDPQPERRLRLARAWLGLDRGRVALEVALASAGAGPMGREALAFIEEAADAAGVPSAQAEIDRARVQKLSTGAAEYRDGPFKSPAGARLSTGELFRLEGPGPTVLYVAESSCRSCSEDLQALKRAIAPGVRVVLIPEVPDEDHALRQVLSLYRYEWPILLGRGTAQAFGLKPRDVLVVARRGGAGTLIKTSGSVATSLPAVLEVFARNDVAESVPRPAWNSRPVERKPLPEPPSLLPEGLAPGEDESVPEAFTQAVAAYRAGRYPEALRLFESLEAKGDGWLLPAEARLNRALCLAAMGQREAARRLLLHIGDSRFQEAVDRALERIGSPERSRIKPRVSDG